MTFYLSLCPRSPVKRRRCGPMGLWASITSGVYELKDLHGKQKPETNGREMGDLYALDFDGVICDSCGESSLSGLKAAKVRWPALFNGVDSTLENWVLDQMRIVRPVVETGYDNLLLMRLLLEMKVPSIRKSSVAEGITVEGVLEKWSEKGNLNGLNYATLTSFLEDRLATLLEDRLATLKNVIREPQLDGDLGYNTQKEREEAASISRIQILQLSDFSKKLIQF